MSRDLVCLTLFSLAVAAGGVARDAAADMAAGTPPARIVTSQCDDVDAGALAATPAPRVILVAGSLPLLTLDPMARLFAALGYPQASLRDPRDGALTTSGYTDSVKLAGIVAWHYEHDGMSPILIGHSRGGMVVVRTLHELAGAFQAEVPLWDPVYDEPLPRTTIRDPSTGAERPVVGLTVRLAAAIATGRLPRVLLGQWSMLERLRRIPDTADEFIGYSIEGDLIADGLLGREPYRAPGRAQVRNVTLPATYGHLDVVRMDHLAADPQFRAWIDAYRPGAPPPWPPAATDTRNLLLAADLWHAVKRAWCLEGAAREARRGAP